MTGSAMCRKKKLQASVSKKKQ